MVSGGREILRTRLQSLPGWPRTRIHIQYIYVYMYVYIYIYMHVYVNTDICMYVYMYVHIACSGGRLAQAARQPGTAIFVFKICVLQIPESRFRTRKTTNRVLRPLGTTY